MPYTVQMHPWDSNQYGVTQKAHLFQLIQGTEPVSHDSQAFIFLTMAHYYRIS